MLHRRVALLARVDETVAARLHVALHLAAVLRNGQVRPGAFDLAVLRRQRGQPELLENHVAQSKACAQHQQDRVVEVHDKQHKVEAEDEHRCVHDSQQKSTGEGQVHEDPRRITTKIRG